MDKKLRDKKLQELKKAVTMWKNKLGEDKNAATYYGLTRGTLMFSSLPEKGMKITIFKLIDLTEQGLANEAKGKVKFYDLAIPDGFIPKEMIPDCLTAVLKEAGNSLALVPDGSFCWDEVALEWQPIEKSELAEFCL